MKVVRNHRDSGSVFPCRWIIPVGIYRVKDTVATMPINEIKKKRYDIADTRQVPRTLQRKAISKGYFIKKSATGRHPYVVSGYMICSSKGKKHNHIIFGEKYNLTLKQVNKFLEREE